MFLNDQRIEDINSQWMAGQGPFAHVIMEQFLQQSVALECYEELKSYALTQRAAFVHYQQRWERSKFTQNKIELMPSRVARVLDFFNSNPFLKYLERVTGLKELVPDYGLWGGGIHCTLSGGKLNIHHDFTVLPTTYGQPEEWHRVLNLIVYLNARWQLSWGGELELWDENMTACQFRIAPVFNRAILFYTYGSNHGQPDPYQGPSDEPRLSLATYYYQKVKPGTIPHRSTFYQIRPGERETPEEKAERLERASEKRYEKFLKLT